MVSSGAQTVQLRHPLAVSGVARMLWLIQTGLLVVFSVMTTLVLVHFGFVVEYLVSAPSRAHHHTVWVLLLVSSALVVRLGLHGVRSALRMRVPGLLGHHSVKQPPSSAVPDLLRSAVLSALEIGLLLYVFYRLEQSAGLGAVVLILSVTMLFWVVFSVLREMLASFHTGLWKTGAGFGVISAAQAAVLIGIGVIHAEQHGHMVAIGLVLGTVCVGAVTLLQLLRGGFGPSSGAGRTVREDFVLWRDPGATLSERGAVLPVR